jgi:cation/acetate symporter
MLVGLISSVVLVLLSPNVWNPEPGVAILTGDPLFPLANPTIFTVPLGFLGAYLGTVLSANRKKADTGNFEEVLFKSNTGFGVSAPEKH